MEQIVMSMEAGAKPSLFILPIAALALISVGDLDQNLLDAAKQGASATSSMASAQSGSQKDQAMSRATPLEFAQRYAEFTQAWDAAAINTLVSDQMTLIWADAHDTPQKTLSREQQLTILSQMYKLEKASGKTIRPADYIITQQSNDFAVIKFTWDVRDPADNSINFAHTSYVIRRETKGWRLVYVMELAPGFGGDHQAKFAEE